MPLDERANPASESRFVDVRRPVLVAMTAALGLAGVALGQSWLAVVALLTLVGFALIGRKDTRGEAPARTVITATPDDADDLRPVLDALPDPVLVVEAEARGEGRWVRYANPASVRLMRIPVQGAALTTAIRDPDVLDAVEEALHDAAPRSIGYETGGSQDRYWRAWIAPLSPTSDGLRQAMVRLRDDTDARRAEMMRVDFLANASHELRTPLASLGGFIETLKGHARDDVRAREKFLDIMAIQTERMGRLVADLLSLSRIEMSEHVPPSGRVDLRAVVADVLDASAVLTAAKALRLDGPTSSDPVWVIGDRDQLIQVAQNLIDNAIKYSPPSGVIEVRLASGLSAREASAWRITQTARMSLLTPDLATGAAYGLVSVRDRGPGMAREHLPRLTERFYRVEGQKSGEHPGTGLGLAIVKHIVNRHGGGMTAESALGEGSVFSAYFPMHSPSPDESRAL